MIQKAIIISAILMAGATIASAQDFVLTSNNISGTQGSTAVIEVNMQNAVAVRDMQMFLHLPEGVSIPQDQFGDYAIDVNPARNPKHASTCNFDGGMYKMAIASVTAREIAAGSGAVAYITVNLDAEPGVYSYSFSNVHLSRVDEENMGIDIPVADFGGTITITDQSSQTYGDNQLYVKDITVAAGQNATLEVGYNSSTDVYEYLTEITLPTGVTVTALEFDEVVNVTNFTNTWNFNAPVLTVAGEYGGGRKDIPAEGGDRVFARATLNTSSLAPGSYEIVVGNQKLFNDDDVYPENYVAHLTVEVSGNQQCATPEISLADGKIQIYCATSWADVEVDITTHLTAKSGNELALTEQFVITAYATYPGMIDSAPVSLTVDPEALGIGESGIPGDVDGDGKVDSLDLGSLVNIITGF